MSTWETFRIDGCATYQRSDSHSPGRKYTAKDVKNRLQIHSDVVVARDTQSQFQRPRIKTRCSGGFPDQIAVSPTKQCRVQRISEPNCTAFIRRKDGGKPKDSLVNYSIPFPRPALAVIHPNTSHAKPVPDNLSRREPIPTALTTPLRSSSLAPIRDITDPRRILWPPELSKDFISRIDTTALHSHNGYRPQSYSGIGLRRQLSQPNGSRKQYGIDSKIRHSQSSRRLRSSYGRKVNYSERIHNLPVRKSSLAYQNPSPPVAKTDDEVEQEAEADVKEILPKHNPPSTALHHRRKSTLDIDGPAKLLHRKQDGPSFPDPTSSSSNSEKTAERDTGQKLSKKEILLYRMLFGAMLVVLNITLLVAYFCTPKHPYLLAFIGFMKSKDLLSTIAGILGSAWLLICESIWRPQKVSRKHIMSVVCAYAESEAQIMKTVTSLTEQALGEHQQVICVILDGKQKDIQSYFTTTTRTMAGSYTTWKGEHIELKIYAGHLNNVPIISIQKMKNAGKKDTLILGHSLFNYPPDRTGIDIQLLRQEIWTNILPALTDAQQFDYVFATDADSMLHQACLKELADALSRNSKAIAACGIIIAQTDDTEWSSWHLFQQFQYTFGQFVRRSAESLWGRVTCLPGPVTMIKVRPETAKALSEYAAPISSRNIVLHQVHYQGTDRRLTCCLLSQNKNLQTILVPKAIGETVVPASLDHYLSQRRRWAANAYFNDWMYVFGKNQLLVTRIFGMIDIVRMSFVYYRVINTALFIHSLLVRHFYIFKIVPTIIVTKSPTTWYMILIAVKEPVLRKRIHKMMCGIVLNFFMSPLLSITVFSRVLISLGDHSWGKTGMGLKEETAQPVLFPTPASPPKTQWSPRKLARIVKDAI